MTVHSGSPGSPGSDDQDGVEHAEHEGSWRELGPWVLVLSAAVPVVLTGETVRRILSGAVDAAYLGFNTEGDDRGPGFRARWDLLQQFSEIQSGLLASAVGAAVLAGVVLLGRPGWLVPHGASRWAALGAAALAALGGLGILVSVLARWSSGEGEPQFYLRTDLFVALAPVSGVGLFALGISTLSAIVVWRSGKNPPPPVPVATSEPAATPEPPAPPVAAPPRSNGVERPRPGTPPEPPEPTSIPRLPQHDEALYRRPDTDPAQITRNAPSGGPGPSI